VGNWAHEAYSIKLKKVPGNLHIYVQLTYYFFYDTDAANPESNEIYANDVLMAGETFLDLTLQSTPLSKDYTFYLYDEIDTLTIKLYCNSIYSPYY